VNLAQHWPRVDQVAITARRRQEMAQCEKFYNLSLFISRGGVHYF